MERVYGNCYCLFCLCTFSVTWQAYIDKYTCLVLIGSYWVGCWYQRLICLENYCIVSLGNISTTKQALTALLFSPSLSSAEVLQQVYQDLLLCSAAVPQKATMAICLHYKLREECGCVCLSEWASLWIRGKKGRGRLQFISTNGFQASPQYQAAVKWMHQSGELHFPEETSSTSQRSAEQMLHSLY